MLGNSDEIRTKTEEDQNSECCYGGFGGRFMYERWKKNGAGRQGGGRNAAVTVLLCAAVAVVCVLSGVVSYNIVVHNKGIYYPDTASVQTAETGRAHNAIVPHTQISVTHGEEAQLVSVNPDMSERYSVPMGVLVRGVAENTPAYDAGMRSGDIIVSVDGTPIYGTDDLNAVVDSREAVATSEIQLFRDGEIIVVKVIF